HGNDADNAAEGAQIGCENRRPRALKRGIIAPHETPNQKRKVLNAKGGDTKCAAMIKRSKRIPKQSASFFTFKSRTVPDGRPAAFVWKRTITMTQRSFFARTGRQ